ncbi:hypothetical protein G9U52_31210 [Paenibacillus sp. S3N08]|uniref:Uncharacterized protein n=2 Tax=Paenibacillus agricola TaxID=2716264 RepID=A0ABX0JK83_9BACL|nr:hypothetical protein [Paenibacillus agricola]
MTSSSFKKKNVAVWFLLILLISLFIEIFIFNFYSIYNNIRINNLLSQDITKKSNIPKDLNLNEFSRYTSLTNDAWLEYKDLNTQVKTIKIELEHSRPNAMFQIFYTTPSDPNYSEENSLVSVVSPVIYMNFNNGTTINNLRLDLTDKAGDSIKLLKVEINPPYELSFNILRYLFVFCLINVSYFLLLLMRKYKHEIIKYRYYIALIVFSFLVLGNIHGSSIGMWDNYVIEKMDDKHSTTLIGEPRSIRSDEWLVQTPWFLSQTQNDEFFPIRNDNIRSDGQNMLIANVPTFSIHLLARPHFWGFILFGKDYGLSWYWMLRLMLLFMLSFELSMFLSNKNLKISIIGSLCISLSPAIQWWYNTSVVDIIIYVQGAIVSALYYVRSDGRKWVRIFFVSSLTLSITGFILVLYPPLQVPLGYMLLIFLGFILIPNIKTLINNKFELIAIIICILYVIVSISTFILESIDDINLILNTIYPGKRVITGGNFDIKELQSYLISWLLPYKDVTFSNRSEVSNFINFFPAILLSFAAIYRYETQNRKLIITLFIYLLFLTSWLILEYPLSISKITLFSYVTEKRLGFIVIGLISIYLFMWAASIFATKKPLTRYVSFLICIIVTIIYYISLFQTQMHSYLGDILSWITIIFFVALNYFLIRGRLYIFTVLMFIMIIVSGATVNPVAHGTASIYEKEISHQLMNIKLMKPNAKWVSVNNNVNSQFLVALGLKTFNSVHYYPDFKSWNILDPSQEFKEVYNRFAHIKILLTDEKTSFKLIQPDLFQVHLNVMDLKKVGIDYVLSQGEFKSEILQKIYYSPKDNLYIYQVITY